MGITAVTLKMLSQVLPKRRILSLGYPDLVMRAEDVTAILGVTPTEFSTHGDWHGCETPIPETQHVMGLIGSTMDCVDIVASRGCERIADLNYPQDLGEYDLVIDSGTTEHCFNVAQALINAAQAVRAGGAIFHSFPMTAMNHGFWNASPTMFADFYGQNGWQVQIARLEHDGQAYEVPTYKRFVAQPETYLCVFAQCPAKRAPMKYPTQQKYVKNPMLTKKAA